MKITTGKTETTHIITPDQKVKQIFIYTKRKTKITGTTVDKLNRLHITIGESE